MSNKIIYATDTKIGNVAAETDDEFLFECFLSHPALSEISDISNTKLFILGSTGAGKTALLRMLEKDKKATFLELEELSMSYISNSDTISFLRKIDVDITIFLQSLWRHVICIELIKQIIQKQNSNEQQFIYKLKNLFRNSDQENELVKYVERYQGNFWNTTDAIISEYTKSIESEIEAEFQAEIHKASARAGYARSLGEEKKIQFQERAKKFVDHKLLSELHKIQKTLSEYLSNQKDCYFILIDKIDEYWIDPTLKNIIIHSLFEACKAIHKIRNLKVVVALRNDVYEKMNLEFAHSQAQIEKNEDFIVRLKWTKEQLAQLVGKRINLLFRRKYTKDNVHFDDIFKSNYGTKHRTWIYMIERTLYRPRDIIKFVNFCFQVAEGKSEISKKDFKNAEKLYSEDRHEALASEWRQVYPATKVLIEHLSNYKAYFEISDFNPDKLVSDLTGRSDIQDIQNDPIWRRLDEITTKHSDDRSDHSILPKDIFQRLHLIGAVGLKIGSEEAWNWIHETQRPLRQETITDETKVKIHPMLEKAIIRDHSKNMKS